MTWVIDMKRHSVALALTFLGQLMYSRLTSWGFFSVFVRVSSAGASGYDGVLPSGPDIAQFKQGVKTVAGKMAVLANGVMNTIQVSADILRSFHL